MSTASTILGLMLPCVFDVPGPGHKGRAAGPDDHAMQLRLVLVTPGRSGLPVVTPGSQGPTGASAHHLTEVLWQFYSSALQKPVHCAMRTERSGAFAMMRSGPRGGRSILLKTSGSLRPPGRTGTWIFLDKRPKLRHPTQLVSESP